LLLLGGGSAWQSGHWNGVRPRQPDDVPAAVGGADVGAAAVSDADTAGADVAVPAPEGPPWLVLGEPAVAVAPAVDDEPPSVPADPVAGALVAAPDGAAAVVGEFPPLVGPGATIPRICCSNAVNRDCSSARGTSSMWAPKACGAHQEYDTDAGDRPEATGERADDEALGRGRRPQLGVLPRTLRTRRDLRHHG
jgi:hypothetical protein